MHNAKLANPNLPLQDICRVNTREGPVLVEVNANGSWQRENVPMRSSIFRYATHALRRISIANSPGPTWGHAHVRLLLY